MIEEKIEAISKLIFEFESTQEAYQQKKGIDLAISFVMSKALNAFTLHDDKLAEFYRSLSVEMQQVKDRIITENVPNRDDLWKELTRIIEL